MACAEGCAGLVSGPRKLKTVGDAELAASDRSVPQRGMEDPGEAESDARRSRCNWPPPPAAGRPRRPAPRAGRPSRRPSWRARLPCFTTRAPAPRTTSAAIVEMLTVAARSPPVPQVSTAGPSTLSGCGVRPAWPGPGRRSPPASRPWRAAPPRSPAICTGVAAPVMISPIAHAVSSSDSDVPGEQAGQHGGPAGHDVAPSRSAVSARQTTAPTSPASSAVTAWAICTASIGCDTTASARDQVASHASSRRPDDQQHGRRRRRARP